MAHLKDQRDVIKRAITMVEQDVSECMLLAESKKDLTYVVRNNALKRKCDESRKKMNFWKNSIQFKLRKKRCYSHLFIYLENTGVLQPIVFTFKFFVSVVYDGCKGIFVNIRYFTETMITIIVKMMSMDHLIVKNTRLHTYNLQSWDRWLSFDKNVIDNSVACFYCPQWLWRSVCEYQILYRNYDHSYCVNDVCGAS